MKADPIKSFTDPRFFQNRFSIWSLCITFFWLIIGGMSAYVFFKFLVGDSQSIEYSEFLPYIIAALIIPIGWFIVCLKNKYRFNFGILEVGIGVSSAFIAFQNIATHPNAVGWGIALAGAGFLAANGWGNILEAQRLHSASPSKSEMPN